MKFDKKVKNMILKEEIPIPDEVHSKIEQTLLHLPELPERTAVVRPVWRVSRILTVVACVFFITFCVMPNVSVTYAKALEQVPVIGDLVRVITIRNYFYEDSHHEMDIDVPKIEDESENNETKNNEAIDIVNKEIDEFTTMLVAQFYKEIEITGNNGYGSIHVDYETVTNTETWFTLKLSINETSASSNNYFKYYHIDKISGQIVELGDLFCTDKFSDVLVEEIKRQMQEEMNVNESVKYWLNDNLIGEEFVSIRKEHNFYFNEKGELVIVFDKYEVAPGSMGCPEFVIKKEVIKDILKPEFQ